MNSFAFEGILSPLHLPTRIFYHPIDFSRVLLKLSLFLSSQLPPFHDPRLSRLKCPLSWYPLSFHISWLKVKPLDLSCLFSLTFSSFFSTFHPTRQFQTLKLYSSVLLTCYVVSSFSIHSLLCPSFLILCIKFSVEDSDFLMSVLKIIQCLPISFEISHKFPLGLHSAKINK